jgi:eukaryotic-like serine/threonine-protein kinase
VKAAKRSNPRNALEKNPRAPGDAEQECTGYGFDEEWTRTARTLYAVPVSVKTGTRLGPYEIVAPIGAGGMGEVWKALDTRLDRHVAIKVIPAALAANAKLNERFDREAKAISALSHPHICTLHDVGHEGGTSFLVMEYLEGESLADRLRRGPLPMAEVLRHGQHIARALEAAHRRGIVHRDLKPGNVMLTRSGAKLLDFGLARIVAAPLSGVHATDLPTEKAPLTAEGTILGTFQYMAPEQLEGLEADARTDIFALGAVLYEMATGRRAFQGASKTSLIASIVSQQPEPISSVAPMSPPALDHVVRKCLEKDPDDRWQSAHDIASELQWIGEAGSEAGIAAPLAFRRKHRSRLAWLMGGFAALALIASNLYWYVTAPSDPETIHLSFPGRTAEYVDVGDPLLSPDGRKVAMRVKRPDGAWVIGLRELRSDSLRMFPGSGRMSLLCWSPRGNELAVIEDGRLKVMDFVEGTSRDISEVQGIPRGGTWSPEDVILFATEGNGIFRVSALGGTSERIVAPEPGRFEIAPMYPKFLRNGNRFLYMSLTRDPSRDRNSYKLRSGRLDSPDTAELGEIGSKFDVLDSGHLLHVVDGTLVAMPFDEKALRFTGKPIPVVRGVNYFMPTGGAAFTAARNGTIAYRKAASNTSIRWFDRDGSRGSALVEGVSGFSVAISPDGQQVAFDLRDTRTGTSDLWLYGLSRDTRSRLTTHPAEEANPVWTPSGNALVFDSDRLRRPDIFIKDLEGSGEERVVVGSDELTHPCDVSPDGKVVVYYRFDPGSRYDLWLADLAGEPNARPFVIAPESQTGARFSRDGLFVAYTSGETGRDEVWLKPFPGPGRSIQISTEGGRVPIWDRERRALYYDRENKIYEVDLETSANLARPEPRFLFEISEQIVSFDVARDGRFLMVISDQSLNEPNNVIVYWSPPKG